jgi:hypothetical protein
MGAMKANFQAFLHRHHHLCLKIQLKGVHGAAPCISYGKSATVLNYIKNSPRVLESSHGNEPGDAHPPAEREREITVYIKTLLFRWR